MEELTEKQKEILNKAFAKAEANGYQKPAGEKLKDVNVEENKVCLADIRYRCMITLILSHSFAKALFGEEKKSIGLYEMTNAKAIIAISIPAYNYHLQQMVLSEDPIGYLESYL